MRQSSEAYFFLLSISLRLSNRRGKHAGQQGGGMIDALVGASLHGTAFVILARHAARRGEVFVYWTGLDWTRLGLSLT